MPERHAIAGPVRGETLSSGRVGACVRLPLDSPPTPRWSDAMSARLVTSLTGHAAVGHLKLDRLVQGFDLGLATAVYGTLALDDGGACLTYGNAGHLPPLVRGRDGTVRRLDHGSSWMIGVSPFPAGSRTDAAVWLPAGSTLVLVGDVDPVAATDAVGELAALGDGHRAPTFAW